MFVAHKLLVPVMIKETNQRLLTLPEILLQFCLRQVEMLACTKIEPLVYQENRFISRSHSPTTDTHQLKKPSSKQLKADKKQQYCSKEHLI